MKSTILPIHHVTGLRAIGIGKRGPIWPVIGGDGTNDGNTGNDDEADDADGGDDDDTEGDDEEDKPLGPKGEKALAAIKEKHRIERQKRLAAEKKLRDAKGDDEAAKREAQIVAKANERIIKSEIRAAASGKLADPMDALKFLDLSQFEVSEDGEIDPDDVNDAIDDLIKKKPYLAAQGGKRNPKPDRRQGGGEKDAPSGKAAGVAEAQRRFAKKK